MQSTNTIGYNLFPREKQQAVIVPCSLDTVTAQFVVTESSADIVYQNFGQNIQIDWGDGTVETNVTGGFGIRSVSHNYVDAAQRIISVYIPDCVVLRCHTETSQTQLKTMYITNLGYGMCATVFLYGNYSTYSITSYPFYDWISINSGGIQTINFGTYDYASIIDVAGNQSDVLECVPANFTNVIEFSCGANKLNTVTIDKLLRFCSLSTSGMNGRFISYDQDPASVPSQSAQVYKIGRAHV